MDETTDNRDYYKQLKKIWDSSKQLAATTAVDENKAWERFKLRRDGIVKMPQMKQRNRFSFIKVAASVIFLLGSALIAYLILNKESTPTKVVVRTEQNVLIETLSDGSEVTLNKKSSLTYQSSFKGDSRSVVLQGEAFFNVTPDKKKPFIITINDVVVTVVGTSFNIRNENGKTEIVVETGIVRVKKDGKTVELKAGEKLLIADKETMMIKEEVTDKLYNYYRSKEFVCDDTPLWKLVEVLNEAYDANISIGRSELRSLRLTTTFNNEALDNVLEIIHLTLDIKVVKEEGKIVLQ